LRGWRSGRASAGELAAVQSRRAARAIGRKRRLGWVGPTVMMYDKAKNQYVYRWQTDTAWAKSGREVYIGFTDKVPGVGDAMLVVNSWFRT